MITTKRKCTYCGKTLVPIGTARSNGKRKHGDWESRTMHKKCWKICPTD